jgi:ATP-dependent Clp protease ATP-binding subunit ClpA
MHVRSYTIALPLLAEADAEARTLGHSYIGPEHLLLAVAEHATGVSRTFLGRHGMTAEGLREAVAALIGPERVSARESGAPLAIAHRSMLALAHALAAGQGAHHWPEAYSADELLVALLADDVAPAATVGAVLEDAGLTLAGARAELAMLHARAPRS